MLTIVASLVFVACVFARHNGIPGSALPNPLTRFKSATERDRSDIIREYLSEPYEQYIQYEDSPKISYDVNSEDIVVPQMSPEDLLSKEISILRNWDGDVNPVVPDQYGYFANWNNRAPSSIILNPQLDINDLHYRQAAPKVYQEEDLSALELPKELTHRIIKPLYEKVQRLSDKKKFALTPFDEGYFDTDNESTVTAITDESVTEMIEPRKTRQNPNLSRAKSLVADNLDELRAGFTNKETGTTDKPRHVHIVERINREPEESIYSTALMAAVGAALAMALFGFVFGWYTLSKKAKAAADVDYPAYGVTGPNVDASGDRKLAHSAHMYHYQHQKQQILAMERGCLGRNGSVSDAESEEENEEGDYTVYECPGLATTGDMEVKNPMFIEEPTPATPAKSEDQLPKD